MNERRITKRRKASRRKVDRIKKIVLLAVATIAFILLSLRLTNILLNTNFPSFVIWLGLLLPMIVTVILILILIQTIRKAKNESSFNFNSLSILIADSNIVSREIITAILEKTGISYDFADNSNAVISMLEGNLCKYNIIFIDSHLPETDGFQTAQSIRFIESEWAKRIPIIAMITNVSKADIDRCRSSGINDYIEKPFDPNDICNIIHKRALFFHTQEEKEKPEHGITWSEGLVLGDEQVDAQHHRMFEVLSNLVTACSEKNFIGNIKETLDFLVHYTIQHFNDEEALMLRYNFPGYKKHKLRHEQFKGTVSELVQRFEKSDSSSDLSSDLMKVVVRWLTNHIMQEDKKIVAHIRSVTIRK